MKCAAFVIGINNYDNFRKLNCAVKDAVDIASVLDKLKFEVTLLTDCTYQQAHDSITNFVDNLFNKYDAAIFYYAGHGAMINRTDCLLMKDAPQFERNDDIKPKAYCLNVDEIMRDFNAIGNQANILIIDACRVSYENNRGMGGAVIDTAIGKIPYQTFISFSTAPGATADDGRRGENSPFATALLSHIEEEDLDIEMLFKKVRNDVKQAGHSQYPWEHTCLLDRFCFNHGQLNKYYDKPYYKETYVRSQYQVTTTEPEVDIITGLNSSDTANQIDALSLLSDNKDRLSASQQFLFGRLLYLSAANGSKTLIKYLSNVSNIQRFESLGGNHLLRGIYYEIFFDENDMLRERPLGDTNLISTIESLREKIKDKDAEAFVIKELPEDILVSGYALGETPDWKFRVKLIESELFDENWKEIKQVEDITIRDTSILSNIKYGVDNLIIEWQDLRHLLANSYSLPYQKIQVIPNTYRDDEWSKVVLVDEIPDIASILLELCQNETPSEVDYLSSLSFIEDIDDITVSYIRQNDDIIEIKGQMIVIVHMEYDGDVYDSMSFPAKFSLKLKHENCEWIPMDLGNHVSVNTELFYK